MKTGKATRTTMRTRLAPPSEREGYELMKSNGRVQFFFSHCTRREHSTSPSTNKKESVPHTMLCQSPSRASSQGRDKTLANTTLWRPGAQQHLLAAPWSFCCHPDWNKRKVQVGGGPCLSLGIGFGHNGRRIAGGIGIARVALRRRDALVVVVIIPSRIHRVFQWVVLCLQRTLAARPPEGLIIFRVPPWLREMCVGGVCVCV